MIAAVDVNYSDETTALAAENLNGVMLWYKTPFSGF